MAAERARDFVTLVRENVHEQGNTKDFTFVSEAGSRTYREEILGFADLDRRARALAVELHARGLRDRAVLLLYPEGLDFLTAFLGCLYARAVAVPAPLPELDAGRSVRTRRIIRDADIPLILTDTAHHEMLRTWLDDIGLTGRVRCLATDTGIDADPDTWRSPGFAPNTLAFLQYTSGSTSDPKGVMVTHGNMLHNTEEIKRVVRGTPDTVGVGWIPHYHDMGLVGQLLSPLYIGCRYVFTSPITFLKRPALWLELISKHRATNTVAPNFGYELLCRRVSDDAVAGLDLSSLRIAQNGAEPVRADTMERMAERFGPIGLRRDALAPCYGMAETTLLVTGARSGDGPSIGEFDTGALTRNEAVDTTGGGRRLVSSGRPVTLDVRIVDPATNESLPERRIGEIWVRGGSVARGYWRRTLQTRETFQAVTADGTGPYLRTGDLGFFSGGELYVTGRIKDVIVVNGCNIYAHDIEEAAQTAHPAARAAAAFCVDIGREQVILVQEVSTRALDTTTPAELASLVRTAVGGTFGLPALSIVLARRGAVRRTTSGKIQRRLTRQDFLDGKIIEVGADLEPEVAALRAESA